MMRTQITPLRSNVGRAISITGIHITNQHPEVLTATVKDVSVLNSYGEAENKDYSSFMPPEVWSLPGPCMPAGGVTNFVTPLKDKRDFAFDPSPKAAFIAILLQAGKVLDPRKLFLEIEIKIDSSTLLGGICYYGHPFLPYFVNEQGESSANYGLPRAITIVCGNEAAGFIDNENVLTLEEPISHSGVHFLGIEPVKTSSIKLRLSDWPCFLNKVVTDRSESKSRAVKFQTAYGLLIPSIIPYEFSERTNYEPKPPFGILACLKPNLSDADYFHYEGLQPKDAGIQNHTFSADYLYLMESPQQRYMNFSVASITGQKRRFRAKDFSMLEEFISTPLKKDELIDIYLEQGEENSRCLSGFRLAIDRSNVPPGTVSSQLIEASVYEIDLPDGVSPVNITDRPEEHKYFTQIYAGEIASFKLSEFTCRFLRPSLSRYFLFRLKNKVDALCQIKITSLELVQSAHVSVVSRSSRVQKIDSVNLRLIGEKLGDDYAKLGDDGFSVTVESVHAGKRKNVLFSAGNLLTLLNSGNARIYSNYRRQETVKEIGEETVTTHAGSNDVHTTSLNSVGWRRNETGSGVEDAWARLGLFILGPTDQTQANLLKGDFDSFGTTETRNYNEQIGPEDLADLTTQTAAFAETVFGKDKSFAWFEKGPQLLRDDENGFDWKNKIWAKGFAGSLDGLVVGMTGNVVIPPSYIAYYDYLVDVASELSSILAWIKGCMQTNNFSVPAGPDLTKMMTLLGEAEFALLNGLSAGFNLGASLYVGGGISISSSPLTPSFTMTASKGTTGNISKQASKTGYTYSQFLSALFDKSRAVTVFDESRMMRRVERLIQDELTERRRKRGWEVMWQNRYVDILTCKIPLGITLPASARNFYEGLDQSIRVRFGGNLINSGVEADVWFDVSEETIKEDY